MKNKIAKGTQNPHGKIDPKKIKSAVPGEVYFFETTKSTNIEAKFAKNVPDKSLFLAERQEAGRGRLGRNWSSPAGTGIWMSIYLEPKITANNVAQLTLLAGFAVSRAIPDSLIKWPNDVLLSGKKVCGILTEMVTEKGRPDRVIVGIGINVNTENFPMDLADKATSIYLETQKISDREEVAIAVLSEFFELYDEFTAKGFDAFYNDYIQKCVTIGREVVIINGDDQKKAKAVSITENGELVIETENGRETVNSGEVSVRGLLGYC